MLPDCTPLKTCTKCGRELPATTDFFFAQRNPRAPLRSRCKQCHTTATSARNRVPAVAERLREQAREKYADNPEPYREKCRRWREANRETMRQCGRNWEAKHPDRRRAKTRNRKARVKGAAGHFLASDVAAQYERQRGRCYWCGEKVGRSYHIDHVVPVSRGGSNRPENLVIACPPCNQAKGAKLPHEWGDRLC